MSTHKPVRKAVFPVAGLGTRFLPATKAIPKEMLAVVDRPLIQYAVDEAREAGIEQMIFVTGRGKTAIVEHFDVAYELEAVMAARGKSMAVLDATRATPGDIITVRQQVPLGLGHAIWCARAVVGDEPFAIFLPDELMVAHRGGAGESRGGCMKQMVEAYDEVGGNLISVLEVPHDEVSSYGVIAPGRQVSAALTEVTGLVEKPPANQAPSNKIISGRYILQPEVMRVLEDQEKGAGGEIQLTDAMLALSKTQPFYGLKFDGRSYDCGSKIGFLTANIAYGLERPAIAPELREEMKRMLGEVWTPNNSRRSLPALYRGNRTLSSGRCRRPWGYAEFIKAIGDASHERHAEIKERLPEDFDPNKVDADWLVREVALLAKRLSRKLNKKRPRPA